MFDVNRKARVFWPVSLSLLLLDCASKKAVVEHLGAPYVPHPVVGDVVRFTLAFNRDAAMGLTLGAFSRVGFALAACVGIAFMISLYRRTPPRRTWQLVGLALACGGAAGNLLDRVRSPRGVVDFIDVGLGAHRFYVFNVADMGVTIGALLLALLVALEHREPAAPAA